MLNQASINDERVACKMNELKYAAISHEAKYYRNDKMCPAFGEEYSCTNVACLLLID